MAALLLLLGACAAPADRGTELVYDPNEGMNRAIHGINKQIDRGVLRPVAIAYDAATPTLFRHVFSNVLSHVQLPWQMLNHAFQGEGKRAASALGRFTMNTVLGAGGFLDPATEFGMPNRPTDFGITLGRWGVGEGFYQEVPLLGPSTLRDTLGRLVEFPFRTLAVLEARARHFELIDDTLYGSDDSYITARALYMQRRRFAVSGETERVEALNDIFAE
ncbi:MAG: VacJ family lipoprotein [Pseudomonadota bacterium]